MGLLCCLAGDKKQAEFDAEARHARIVRIYHESSRNASTCPPAYNEVVTGAHVSITGPTIVVNEKEPAQIEQSRSSSPRTSIISIPSTRLTDLTASITGASSVTNSTIVARDESDRMSAAFASPPPSYYAGSTCYESSTRTPTPELLQTSSNEHPVMSPDWLDRLRKDAERGRSRQNR